MVNTSDASRKLWLETMKCECPGLAEKSFWAWYQCAMKVVSSWSLISSFLKEGNRRGLAKKSFAMSKSFRPLLFAELNFILVFGKPFHDAGFQLEGDGFCCPFVQAHLSLIQESLALWRHEQLNHFSIRSATATNNLPRGVATELGPRLLAVVAAVDAQFQNAVLTKMSNNLPLVAFVWTLASSSFFY